MEKDTKPVEKLSKTYVTRSAQKAVVSTNDSTVSTVLSKVAYQFHHKFFAYFHENVAHE